MSEQTETSYGVEGCRCWVYSVYLGMGNEEERWMPNAYCPHHGLPIFRKDAEADDE